MGFRPEGSGWVICSYRTARANNPGMVLTFVLPTEQSHLDTIEELLSGGKHSALFQQRFRPSGGDGGTPCSALLSVSSLLHPPPTLGGQGVSPQMSKLRLRVKEQKGQGRGVGFDRWGRDWWCLRKGSCGDLGGL